VTVGPWAIGGLSMGGYGAIRLGLKHPEMFASIYAHSSAFHMHEMLDPTLAETTVDDASVFCLADAVASRESQPAISFDCGTEDRLLDVNRQFHEHLQGLNIAHRYAEFPGDHDWDYWDEHVVEALAQHARVLGVR
jgi:putative tributyrin esterase